MKKKAFTLAEVLITLGIIGIVAAMTLPTLIQRNQKQVAATRLKQTYAQLYQAINMAQADYGDMKNWSINSNYGTVIDPTNSVAGINMAEAFSKTYLLPYLKYNGTPKRLKYAVNYYTKDGRLYKEKNVSQAYTILLANGVELFLTYDSNSDVGAYSFPSIFVDINGETKPNVLGQDFFMFHFDAIKTMKIKPYGYGKTREALLPLCSRNASRTYDNLQCTALIMLDGWEIKKDYPW